MTRFSIPAPANADGLSAPTDRRMQPAGDRDPFASRLQRASALAKGNGYRSQRAALRRVGKGLAPCDGAERVSAILHSPPASMATMTIERLICTIHGFGPVKANQIAGTSRTKQLGIVSAAERARIAAECTRRAEHMVSRPSPPPVKRAQFTRALETATQVRLARVDARRKIAGERDLAAATARAAQLITEQHRDHALDGMTVQSVLEAIPRVGEIRARKILRMLDMNHDTPLCALSASRAHTLATIITAAGEQAREHNKPAMQPTPFALAA